MSTQSTPGIDDAGTTDHPSRSDGFVRGMSSAIGGPLGDHATALDRPAGQERRFWTAVRIVLALACLTLALHWVQKSPCQDGAWQNNVQYTRFCYTDVLALYYAEGLNEGKVPYRDHPVEYPVLTGYFMGALGLPVHAIGEGDPSINQAQWFYNLNALVLGALAVATVAVILALRRRRPWDAALFALAPALLLTATVNWDLLAIGLAAFGLLAWARKRPAGGRRAARARRCGEAVAAVPARAAPRPGAAGRPDPRRAHRHRHGDRRVGAGEPAGRPGIPGELGPVLRAEHHPAHRLGHALVHRPLPGRQGRQRPRPTRAVRVAERQHPHPQHHLVRAVRVGLSRCGRADAAGTASPAAGAGRLPGGRRVPHLQQGLVAAVRAVAAAAGGAGPTASGVPSWPGRSPRSATSSPSTESCSARRPAVRSSRRGCSCWPRRSG